MVREPEKRGVTFEMKKHKHELAWVINSRVKINNGTFKNK